MAPRRRQADRRLQRGAEARPHGLVAPVSNAMIVGLEHWTLARPEIFLAVATALLLLYGVLRGEVATAFISVAASIALLVTAVLLFMPYREGTAFANLFITDRLTTTMKALVLVGAAIAILMSRAYFEHVKILALRISADRVAGHARHDADDLGQRPDVALCRARAAVAGALRHRRLPARLGALDRGRREVLRPGLGRLGHAAVRRLADLRLLRRHLLRADLAGAAGRQGGRDRHRHRPGVRGRGPGLQDLGRAVPHVDARRLRGRADAGDGACSPWRPRSRRSR